MRADTWVGEKCIKKQRKSIPIQKALAEIKKKKKGERQGERHVNVSVDIFITLE